MKICETADNRCKEAGKRSLCSEDAEEGMVNEGDYVRSNG